MFAKKTNRIITVLTLLAAAILLLSACGRAASGKVTATATEAASAEADAATEDASDESEPEAAAPAPATETSAEGDSPLDTPDQPTSPLGTAEQPDSPLPGPTEDQLAADAIFVAGSALLKEGDYAEAQALYDNALADGILQPRVFEGSGDVKLELRQYMAAIDDYSAGLELAETPELLTKRCSAGIYVNRFDESVDDCERALRLDRNQVDAYLALSELHFEDGKNAIARSLADSSLAITETGKAYHLKGIIDLAEQRWDDALKHLSLSIDLDPSSQETYWERGMLYLAMGESKKVIDDMYSILEVSSTKKHGDWMFRASSQIRLLTGEYPVSEQASD